LAGERAYSGTGGASGIIGASGIFSSNMQVSFTLKIKLVASPGGVSSFFQDWA